MKPMFPSSPLKFRTAGFPQYGFKVGFSDRAFPLDTVADRFASALRAFGSSIFTPHEVGETCPVSHRHSSVFSALPQGSSLRSGFFCPGPSTLNRPHPPHSRVPLGFIFGTYTRCLGCAFPPRPPMSGSELSRHVLFAHVVPETPESWLTVINPIHCQPHWPSPKGHGLGTLNIPTIHFRWGFTFGATCRFALATTCAMASLPGGSDQARKQPSRRRRLHPGFRRESHLARCRE